jgi:hypothetical protein
VTSIFNNLSAKPNFLVLYSARLVNPDQELVLQLEEAEATEWFTPAEAMQLPIFYDAHKKAVQDIFSEPDFMRQWQV